MLTTLATIQSLFPKSRRSRKSYASATEPRKQSGSHMNDDCSSSPVRSTQRKSPRKKNVDANPNERVTILIKVWLKVCDFYSFPELMTPTVCSGRKEFIGLHSVHSYL